MRAWGLSSAWSAPAGSWLRWWWSLRANDIQTKAARFHVARQRAALLTLQRLRDERVRQQARQLERRARAQAEANAQGVYEPSAFALPLALPATPGAAETETETCDPAAARAVDGGEEMAQQQKPRVAVAAAAVEGEERKLKIPADGTGGVDGDGAGVADGVLDSEPEPVAAWRDVGCGLRVRLLASLAADVLWRCAALLPWTLLAVALVLRARHVLPFLVVYLLIGWAATRVAPRLGLLVPYPTPFVAAHLCSYIDRLSAADLLRSPFL